MAQHIWFITGASRGMGACFAQAALDADDMVVATARRPQTLTDAFGEHENLLPLALDVTDADSIAAAVNAAEEAFGRIDILLNNAGYGIFGAVEETSDAETRAMFDTNLFGTMNVIRAVLPGMRAQNSGRIVNIASAAGYSVDPGGALYDCSKAAVIALTEVLAQELEPFNIESMAVCPGMIRTNFFGNDSMKVAENLLPAYEGTPARGAIEYCQSHDGQQFGDPEKVAQLVYEVATAAEPMPIWLPMGKDAMKKLFRKCEAMTKAAEPYFERSAATAFPRK